MSRIPTIKIEQQYAEIGVNNNHAQLRINNPRKQMRVTNDAPNMDFESTMPKVSKKKTNSGPGVKSPAALPAEINTRGRGGVAGSTRKALEDGSYPGEFMEPGEKVANQGRSRAAENFQSHQFNIGLTPEDPAEISWEKGQMRVSWSSHSLVIDWDGDYMPQVSVDPPHSVEVYLRTKPYFRVLVEENVPLTDFGAQVDQRI